MNKLMLQPLLEIFAIIANTKNAYAHQLTESYIEIYFTRMLNPRLAKEKKAEFSQVVQKIKKDPSSVNINTICKAINKELSIGQRVILLINLIDFVNFTEKNALRLNNGEDPIYDFIAEIAYKLKISKNTFGNCKNFVSDQLFSIPDQEKLVFAREGDPKFSTSKYLPVKGIKGVIIFFYVEEAGIILFKYNGSSILELNSILIFPRNIYTLYNGSVITSQKNPLVYYSQVVNLFNQSESYEKIALRLQGVNYTHKNSSFGVKNISISCKSGELIGVLGGSGSGKSTLLNVINGNLKPDTGSISINGIDFHENLSSHQRLIGFVPQDDSLIGELTVSENLRFTTALAAAELNRNEIKQLVENKLSEFTLYHIRNQQVGLPIKRMISGGQRKRLNIVSEVVREPHILMVDEPTSGLSSSDSFKIVLQLKEQATLGKLVILNIHQPSSEIFRLFDKVLILDQGGYMAFYGNPIEAIEYFKDISGKIDSETIECITCHTLKPDEIFEIIEEKQVDEVGEITEQRKRSPEEWSALFAKKIAEDKLLEPASQDLPKIRYSKPSRRKQLSIFLRRFTLTKIRDLEFIAYSIAIPTLLAFVLSFFCKYSILSEAGIHQYNYYENDNIPIFFLMSIISCLFTGIILTADCIIRDSVLRKREKFLFLDVVAYLNSKLFLFVVLSILQTLIFTVISFGILKIPGAGIKFWLILFLSSIIGNITGIIVSSIIKSAAAAFIVVPFLIIPQIIFSGIAIPFDKLNFNIASYDRVPFIGNMTFSRWGIEALLVDQFMNNKYEKHLFDYDLQESQTRVKTYFLIPEIDKLVNSIYQDTIYTEKTHYKITLINDGLEKLGLLNEFKITGTAIDKNQLEKIFAKLAEQKSRLNKIHSTINNQKNAKISELAQEVGSLNQLIALKNRETNKGIEKLVLNRQSTKALEHGERKLIQNIDPVFIEPSKWVFNTHFYAHSKIFLDQKINTFGMNVFVLMFVFVLLYVFLILYHRFGSN